VESAEFDAVFDAEGMVLADRGDELLFAERLRFQSVGQWSAWCKCEVERPIRQKRRNIADSLRHLLALVAGQRPRTSSGVGPSHSPDALTRKRS